MEAAYFPAILLILAVSVVKNVANNAFVEVAPVSLAPVPRVT
jgi:hypothetical protein